MSFETLHRNLFGSEDDEVISLVRSSSANVAKLDPKTPSVSVPSLKIKNLEKVENLPPQKTLLTQRSMNLENSREIKELEDKLEWFLFNSFQDHSNQGETGGGRSRSSSLVGTGNRGTPPLQRRGLMGTSRSNLRELAEPKNVSRKNLLGSGKNYVSEKKIIERLKDFGFDPKDPNTIKCLSQMKCDSTSSPPGTISLDQLKKLPPTNPIIKALCETVQMTDWKSFTSDIVEFFHQVAPNTDGEAAIIMVDDEDEDEVEVEDEDDEREEEGQIQKSEEEKKKEREVQSNKFAVAVCSVDGQQFSYGDSDEFFSIQGGVKPFLYALACEEHGLSEIHKWVGTETSGLSFNEISLNSKEKPHNPMINSGAIQCAGFIKPHMSSAARFRFLIQQLEKLSGGHKIGFSQDTYLGEFETSYRNNAIIHFMKQANAFPPNSKSEECLDMYLQGCSLEVNTQIMAIIAASLANKGVCPLTQTRCLSPWVVKNTLSLMFSCGMYDYSGEWSVNVGLPAKSGSSGLIFVVVPNLLGIAIYSPRIDSRANSVRAIELSKSIMKKYQFGPFDQILQRVTGGELLGAEKIQGRRGGKYLWFLVCSKIQEYMDAFKSISNGNDFVLIQDIEFKMRMCGINPKCRRVVNLISKINDGDKKKRIYLRDLLIDQREEDNLIMKCLKGTCCLPDWENFTSDIKSLYHLSAESCDEGVTTDTILQELGRIDSKLFGVSLCSIDGQCFDLGDYTSEFPLLSCVQPFIYALACENLGVDYVHKYVGREPTSLDPHGFRFDRNGKPYNPFVDSGALAVASLLEPEMNATRRYKSINKIFSEFSGGSRLTFSQPIFLEQKAGSHMLTAIAHMMRGNNLFPPSVGSNDALYTYLECGSIEVSCKKLAVMAATLANAGVCPVTKQKLIKPEITKSLYSLLYNCGTKNFSGFWNFHIGIPATFGEAGCLMVVIPNVMGLVIYSPKLNECQISSKAIRFCELLSKKFRFGIFDQLVFGDKEFTIPVEEQYTTPEDELLFFNLANECASGNYADVEALVLKNPHIVNMSDYDRRTPLHLACSEGHEQIVRLLVTYGAKVDALDRWNNSPLDDAKSHKHLNLIPILEEGLVEQDSQHFQIQKKRQT